MKTGARAAALLTLLAATGATLAPGKPRPPRLEDFASETAARIVRLYRELGGVLAAPRLAPGSWDIALNGGLLVELDEELHFTRYRAQTLRDPHREPLPWSADYLTYCDLLERGGTGGNRWTNPSAARMFGGGDAAGVFADLGAPRWKQRALYDAMKDAAAAEGLVRLARLSVHDVIDGGTLGDVLRGKSETSIASLGQLLEHRTISPEAMRR